MARSNASRVGGIRHGSYNIPSVAVIFVRNIFHYHVYHFHIELSEDVFDVVDL
jgi:hypothetical protein